MRRKYERSYKNLKNQIPQILIFSIFLVGIIIGSIFSNTLDRSVDSEVAELSKLVDGFIVNINLNGLSNSYLLGRSILTYSKQILLIWVFGFFPITIPLIGLLIGIQGFSYGFTTSFFVMEYNLKGLLLCFAAYGVQGTLFVFVMFLLSIEAIRFGRKDKAVSPKMYVIYLFIAILAVIMIALYESYIAPVIIQEIITTFF